MKDTVANEIEVVRVSDMVKAGLHIGHLASKWNPKIAPYIYKKQNKIHIFDLRKTLEDLRKSWEFIYKINFCGGKILFISHDTEIDNKITELSSTYKMPYAIGRWISGTLTNYNIIATRIARLNELNSIDFDNDQEYVNLPKNEKLLLIKERNKLRKMISGLEKMGRLPNAILVIGVDLLSTPIKEANKLGIPVIGVIDSNCNINSIDYKIYGSDDSLASVQLVLKIIESALRASKADRENQRSDNKSTKPEIK